MDERTMDALELLARALMAGAVAVLILGDRRDRLAATTAEAERSQGA